MGIGIRFLLIGLLSLGIPDAALQAAIVIRGSASSTGFSAAASGAFIPKTAASGLKTGLSISPGLDSSLASISPSVSLSLQPSNIISTPGTALKRAAPISIHAVGKTAEKKTPASETAKTIQRIGEETSGLPDVKASGTSTGASYGVGRKLQELLTRGLISKRRNSSSAVPIAAAISPVGSGLKHSEDENKTAGAEAASPPFESAPAPSISRRWTRRLRDILNSGARRLKAALSLARAPRKNGPLNIVMASSESQPFIKTGGLADVIDDVSRELAARGHHVTVVLPKYSDIDEDTYGLKRVPGRFMVEVGGRDIPTRIWRTEYEGVQVIFIENEDYFGRLGTYGNRGYGYSDNDERFIFFSRAAIETMKFLNQKADVFHSHDWQAGLIPAYLKLIYDKDPFFAGTRSVMTVHNIAYQGLYHKNTLGRAGFGDGDFVMERLEYYGQFSFLKAGLAFADAITTVSPNYAEELMTEESGYGLDGQLRFRRSDLRGILNGIDQEVLDPRTDSTIPYKYGVENAEGGKDLNKLELQKRFGMTQSAGIPVFIWNHRLTHQKGADLLLGAAEHIVALGGQLYITADGEKNWEAAFKELAEKFSENIVYESFDGRLEKTLVAAADFLLMPSLFEPCGLAQQKALRYGALVVASKVGGIADTVVDIREDPENGTGFFMSELTAEALQDAITAAALHFRGRDAFAHSRLVAMLKDLSWSDAIQRYVDVYRGVLAEEPYQPPLSQD